MAEAKTIEEIREGTEFFVALKAFCLSHGYEIAGTCESEGIYGEISVFEIGQGELHWADWDRNKFNFEPL